MKESVINYIHDIDESILADAYINKAPTRHPKIFVPY